jgi:two-component system cell cycle response regulator
MQGIRAEVDGRMEPEARILVAEDSALLRRVIGDVLREQGWLVLEAADGASALHMARTEDPSVLLMAREMEGLDGLAVLDALRADPHTEDMPVVFVTGHTDATDLALGLARGAHDYVRKPVDPVELVARIGTALRLRALHDELARRMVELEQLARTDVLTGLANRRHADDVLRATIAAARRHGRTLSAVVVDVDNFKAVNDVHGHAAGDAVLREIARRLAAGLREEDTAARWGGEEFLLLLPDSPDAGGVCERLRASVAERPVNVHGLLELPVSASFGWAPWTGEETGEALIGRADVALYAAKAAGRDRVMAARPAAASALAA